MTRVEKQTMDQNRIDAAAEALRDATRPRIHTGLGVSDVHIRHKLRATREKALEWGVEAVKHARNLKERYEQERE